MATQCNPLPAARARRRSGRVQLKIQVTLTPAAGGGWVTGETVTVSKFGARVRLRGSERKLACGEKVAVAIERARRSCTGRVVWLDGRNGPQCGIEIEQPGGFWGVYFPGNDQENVPSASAAAATLGAAVLSPEAMLGPANPSREQRDIVGVVSGLSAVYSGFTERTVFRAQNDELTGLMATPVNDGARLRIVADSALLYGRVLAVSPRRIDGKWPVRLKVVSSPDSEAN